MKTKTKSILALAAASFLVTGLCQTAKATLSQYTDYAATLSNGSTSFTLASEYFLEAPGVYEYSYAFSGANVPIGLSALSVYFSTGAAGITGQGGNSPVTGFGVNPGDLYWQFNPNTDTANVWFLSPVAPSLGDASAQDGGLWGNGSGGLAYGVVVPNIPDGGLTMSLLGGSLLGLAALRRKLS